MEAPSLQSLWQLGMERLGLAGEAAPAASPGGRDVETAPAAGAEAAPVPRPPQTAPPPDSAAAAAAAGPPPQPAGSRRFRALLSVHDKEGAVHLAKELAATGEVELISTGGTHRLLAAAALPVTQLAAETGFPEVLDGKWGTRCMANDLHAEVVTRSHRLHESQELRAHNLRPMDLVVMNLFLFGSTVQPHTAAEDAVENIDIGTPTILRAAARNYPNVVVLVDPADYAWVGARLRAATTAIAEGKHGAEAEGCGVTLEERRHLAYKAFRHVAVYDLSVAEYLGGVGVGVSPQPLTAPSELAMGWRKLCTVRAVGAAAERDATVYAPLLELDAGVEGAVGSGLGGANPSTPDTSPKHSRESDRMFGVACRCVGGGGICAARKLSASELTLPRLSDADTAWRAVVAFAAASPESDHSPTPIRPCFPN